MISPDGYVSTQSKWSDGQKTVFYLLLNLYYQNEVELKAYQIVSRIRTANTPVGATKSSLPDKQSQMLEMNISKRMRILDIGAGYGRIKEELEKAGKSDAEWYLFNLDLDQHKRTKERFANDPMVHAVNTYEAIEDYSIDAIILANVIHEITPLAFREILRQIEKKLATGGRLYVIDMEPLLYAEHYAVPYNYSEIEELLNDNGWVCNHDITPHRFVALYIVTAEKIGSAEEYDIEKLWMRKRRNALAVYRTAKNDNLSDYQKMMQAMTTVCSIDSFFEGVWR